MKKLKLFVLFIVLLSSFIGCSSVVSEEPIKKSIFNGLFYEKGTKNLYTEINTNYYKSEEIHSKVSYKNGKLDGESINYYESGEIYFKETYKNGLREGKETGYYKSGKIKWIDYYKEDKPVGESIVYYENGEVKVRLDRSGLFNKLRFN